MRIILSNLKTFAKKADLVLLGLCCLATVVGIIAIASATSYLSSNAKYIAVQSLALGLGIVLYILLSFIDIDIIAEHTRVLYCFSILFIGALTVFGVQGDTGNKAWMQIPLIGISIQPAEICKVFFIIVLAKSMALRRDKVSAPSSVMLFVFELGVLVVLIVGVSADAGSAIVYCAIFIVMALAAGISPGWFIGGIAGVCGLMPILWQNFMRDDQKNRILVLLDNTIDPQGSNERYQMLRTQTALGSGKLFGQGYGNGAMTQSGAIPAQHTDCIFASIGEEMGYLGCLAVLLLLTAIVLRCIIVGVKTANYTNRLICMGISGMLMFQIIINLGLVIGVLPVIGLTLPFISYGGSSIVTSFAAMGIVSSIKSRPESDSTVRYLRPPVRG